MTSINAPLSTRRSALAAAVAALAWRPTWAAEGAGAGQVDALHVLDRLAFGPTPGELDRVSRMGTPAWIDEQLHPERLALPSFLVGQLATLRTPNETQREMVQQYRELTSQAKQARQAETASPDGKKPPTEEGADRRRQVAQIHAEAGEERLLQALDSPRQLQEVLVDFWFNHFNVFQGKGLVRVLVESYEREAIRPNVLGRFRTMLGATAQHPAMLFYLDNWLSVAPGYQPPRLFGAAAGAAKASGLNENYAREVMELHTLGVDGGYTQQDVTELARILTGWTMAARAPKRRRFASATDDPANGHGDSIFRFDPARHDNGAKQWLGHAVPPNGQLEGEFALDVLARHPATATHIAFKLARRFVADQPSPALVARLSRRFLDTDGDLRAVMQALADSPEFRDPKPVKFKTPYQYVMSSVRATGIVTTNVKPLMAVLRQLGQPLYGCQTPDGYHDTEADWLNPNAITQRVNFATALASGRLPLRETDTAMAPNAPGEGATPPVEVGALLATLGPAISDKTLAAVAAAPPRCAPRWCWAAPISCVAERLPETAMQRRQLFQMAAAAGLGWSAVGRTAFAATAASASQALPGNKRLIVVFLRGAVDGLSVVVPYSEGAYARQRPTIALGRPGQDGGVLDLDGHFGLNPNLAPLMPLWQSGKLAFVQASGSPDPTRSHFDAQDYMESGTPGRKGTPDGWLNRLLGAEPPRGVPAGQQAGVTRGISVGATLPRIWAGPNPVANIANGARATRPTLLDRPQVSKAFDALYAGDDAMSRAYRESQQSRAEVGEAMTPAAMDHEQRVADNGAPLPNGFPEDAARLAQLMRRDPNVQIAFLALGGWDTHVNQGGARGQLANRLQPLGQGLAELAARLGPTFDDTTLLVISEFGRTASQNGTNGTDHGHGNVMWALGGNIAGGKVYGRWPGIDTASLNDGRDLAVTTDFRQVMAGVCAHNLGLSDNQLAAVFPGFAAAPLNLARA